GNASSSDNSSSRARPKHPDDRKLLYQAIIITIFLQLDNVTLLLNAIYDGDGWLEYFVNIIDLITAVLNHSTHSTIFILSNQTIRGFLPHISFAELQQRLRCW
ncbi:hypothetical protein PMAYCL1PPCAC_16161, partial [Pristionchus mayeri]